MSAEQLAAKPSRYVIVAQLKLSSIDALEQAISKLGNACRLAESAWIVVSTHPLSTLHNLLRPVVRPADKLVIADIARDKATWAGYGPSEEARLRQMWTS